MKAAVCHAFGEPLSIEEVELAAPRAGEVRVKIGACAICHSDIHYMEGAWGGILPAVYGHEAAGRVEAVGSGVTDLAPGDHVVVTLIRACGTCHHCCQGDLVMCETPGPAEGPLSGADRAPIHQGLSTGAFAEAVVVDRSQVVTIPEDIPFDVASLLACGVITGLGAVTNSARVRPNSSVVVVGSGGVGLNSVQGARLVGANPIIAVDLSDSKLEAARTFGATDTINAGNEDIAKRVRQLTEGRGADYAFITVGAQRAIEEGFHLLRAGGTLVIVGMPAAEVRTAFDPGSLAALSQRVIGSKMGSARIAVDIPKLVALYRQGRLKLDELITRRYPLEDINEAVAAVNRGEALRNVIVFED